MRMSNLLSMTDKEGLPPLRGLPDEALEPPKTLECRALAKRQQLQFFKYADQQTVTSTLCFILTRYPSINRH